MDGGALAVAPFAVAVVVIALAIASVRRRRHATGWRLDLHIRHDPPHAPDDDPPPDAE